MSRDRPLGDEFHYHLTLPEYLIDKGGRFACLLFPGGKCLNEKFCAQRKYKLFWFFSLQFFPLSECLYFAFVTDQGVEEDPGILENMKKRLVSLVSVQYLR